MAWLEKLLELIEKFWGLIMPYYCGEEFNAGVVMRNGTYLCDTQQGIRLKWPLFDYVMEANRVSNPIETTTQTLITKDNRNISVQIYYEFEIVDPEVFLLHWEDCSKSLMYKVMSECKRLVLSNDYDRIRSEAFSKNLYNRVLKVQDRYGVRVPDLDVLEIYDYDRSFLTYNPTGT